MGSMSGQGMTLNSARLSHSIGNSVRFNWPHVTVESWQSIHTVTAEALTLPLSTVWASHTSPRVHISLWHFCGTLTHLGHKLCLWGAAITSAYREGFHKLSLWGPFRSWAYSVLRHTASQKGTLKILKRVFFKIVMYFIHELFLRFFESFQVF